jgi:hypothetical protein
MKEIRKGLKSTATFVLVAFSAAQAMADSRSPLNGPRDTSGATGASEYMFSNDPDEILVPIYLMGAVGKPGLYHVPAHTDLLTLLTLSGGTTNDAKSDQVFIRHQQGKKTIGVSEVNLDHLVSTSEIAAPTLASNDFVYVPVKQPSVSNNTLLTVGLVATVISVLATGLVAYEVTKK